MRVRGDRGHDHSGKRLRAAAAADDIGRSLTVTDKLSGPHFSAAYDCRILAQVSAGSPLREVLDARTAFGTESFGEVLWHDGATAASRVRLSRGQPLTLNQRRDALFARYQANPRN